MNMDAVSPRGVYDALRAQPQFARVSLSSDPDFPQVIALAHDGTPFVVVLLTDAAADLVRLRVGAQIKQELGGVVVGVTSAAEALAMLGAFDLVLN